MSDVHWIRPGIEFVWHGERVVIRSVGAMVRISAVDGSKAEEVPLVEIAAALRGDTAPPDLAQLHDIEDRLSERSKARFESDSDLLHIMLTGRHSYQPDTDPPLAGLAPALAPEGVRRRRLAMMLHNTVRDSGKRKGSTVSVGSEMRRLQRIMKRWRDKQNLLDSRYTRPRTWRTKDDVMDALLEFMNNHALKSTKSDRAMGRAFAIDCAKHRPSLVLPSSTTLFRRVAEIRGGWSHLGASAKNRISEMNIPESSGMSRLATRPGELVLFDTTKSNVLVQDPRTGRKFRLDVTLAIDLATRCVVGLAITHTTTHFAIGLCLADVLRPKTAVLAKEWASDNGSGSPDQPFVGRPDAFVSFHSTAFHPEGVVVDNGKQYVSAYVTAQMGRLKIHYEPQRSYTPTDKAQVERVFRTVKDMFESLMPGFTGGSVHEKGRDPQNEQLMAPEEFERRMRQCIDFYNHRTHDGLVLPEDPFARLSPYMMYGILAAKVGAIPDIEYQHDWVRFLPSVTAKISHSRVRVRRLNFTSPALRELQGDPVVRLTGQLRVYYDPTDLRMTWCFDADGDLHPLRWHHLTKYTPKFGEFHTNHVVEQYGDKKMSANDTERILVDIFTGKHDTEPGAAVRQEVLVDTLLRARAADLIGNGLDTEEENTVLVPAVAIKALPPAPSLVPLRETAVRTLDSVDATSPALAAIAAPVERAEVPSVRRERRALRPYNQSES